MRNKDSKAPQTRKGGVERQVCGRKVMMTKFVKRGRTEPTPSLED